VGSVAAREIPRLRGCCGSAASERPRLRRCLADFPPGRTAPEVSSRFQALNRSPEGLARERRAAGRAGTERRSAREFPLAADAIAVCPEIEHPAVGAALLTLRRRPVRALLRARVPLEPLP